MAVHSTSSNPVPLNIRHNTSAHRFEADVDGSLCELDYTLSNTAPDSNVLSNSSLAASAESHGLMTITHTGVPAEVGGRGIAGDLVRAALVAAREQAWKVVPACAYAQTWMKRHPEFEDLRA